MKRDRWKSVGWQGILLSVPVRWDIASFEGSRRKGRFLMDDGEKPRLEVRWDKDETGEPFEKLTGRYLERLSSKTTTTAGGRERRGAARQIEIRRRLSFVQPAGRETLCFEWNAEPRALSMLSRCRDCRRVVLISAFGRPFGEQRGVFRRVFGSLRDHSDGTGDFWSVYGLRCAAPEGFELEKAVLEPGRIRLEWVHRRTTMSATRMGPASVLLRRKQLAQWTADMFGDLTRRIKWQGSEPVNLEHLGHDAVERKGHVRRRTSTWDMLPRRFPVVVRLWHCTESDKLFGASMVTPATDSKRFNEFCASFLCHSDRLPDENR